MDLALSRLENLIVHNVTQNIGDISQEHDLRQRVLLRLFYLYLFDAHFTHNFQHQMVKINREMRLI